MFKQSLPAIMTGITQQFGLRLSFGSNPKTDGKTVHMPDMPLYLDDDRAITKVMGGLTHECGHISHTSFKVLKEALLDKLTHGIFNAVEDVRMEKATMSQLRGAKMYFAQSYQYLTEDGQARTGTNGAADALITYCFTRGAISVNSFVGVKTSYESSRTELVKLIGEKGVAQVNVLLAKIDGFSLEKIEGTKQTLELAKEIVQLIKDLSQGDNPNQQQPSQSQKGEGSSENDQNEGENQSSGNKPDEDQSGDDNSSSKENDSNNEQNEQTDSERAENNDQSSNDAANADKNSNDSQEGNTQDQSDTSAGAKAILEDGKTADTSEFGNWEKATKEIINKARKEGATFTNEVGEKGDDQQSSSAGLSDAPSNQIISDLAKYNVIKSNLNGEIALLKRQLVQKFASVNKSTKRLTEDRGRLDIRSAIRGVTTGNTMIYKETVKQVENKPAISLLIDQSKSMGGQNMTSAQQAAIALLEVCDASAIKVEVISFDDNPIMVKSFDMPTAKAKGKIGGITPNGGTDTAKAVYQAGKRLASRKEGRKIMIVVTDGYPSSVSDTKNSIDLLKRAGVEVIALGLGTDAVKKFCDQYSLVSPENLATTMLQAF